MHALVSDQGMQLDTLKTSDLAGMAAPYNPRRISDHDMKRLRASLKTWGMVEPLVCNRRTNHIVGGHQRVKAALAEGVVELPVFWVDLDDIGERQLNLALNRIHGEWDEEALGAVLEELKQACADLELTGFDGGEVDRLIAELQKNEGIGDPDAVPEPMDEVFTQRGDLITLGAHRLMCGDSGDEKDLDWLLGGAPIHLVNTDPPYNVKVEPRSNNAIAAGLSSFQMTSSAQLARSRARGIEAKPTASAKKKGRAIAASDARDKTKSKPTGRMRPKDRTVANDFVSDEAFGEMLLAWFGNLSRVLLPGRSFYIWGGYANVANYPAALKASGLYFSQAVIWVKEHPVLTLTRKDFMGNHEWCFYGWREGAGHKFFGPSNAVDVWAVKKVNPQSMVHLTEKPVELAERAIGYSSQAGEHVLDLFGGSGSTLIGCERTGRRAFLMELDPAYCDVIVRRWEQFTGRQAEGWRGHA